MKKEKRFLTGAARGRPIRHGQCSRAVIVCLTATLLTGCATPNAANIELRKQIQTLQDENAKLTIEHTGDEASLVAREPTTGPARASLSPAELDSLFTTHGIRLGRLTGGADLDPNSPGDEGLKIHLIPTDDDHDDLKAAGSATVDAFDLAAIDTHVGHWQFSAAQMRTLWNGQGLLYEYILTCPWQKRPEHRELTLHVTFTDALTGRSFSEQKVVDVKLP